MKSIVAPYVNKNIIQFTNIDMKIIIDASDVKDLEVEEILEPTYCAYTLKQGENTIVLNEYTIKELIKSLEFIRTR